VLAVSNISLDIKDGEFVILLGPSGCGKSTALRMIAGLESVTSGEVFIGGRCVNDVAPRDRNIAVVFQSYALYPHMTVAENLAFGLKMHRRPSAEIQAQVKRVAKLLGIEPLLARRPAALSGGQRQRVALGRALVRNPVAFLLDEPLSNLDARLRADMRLELVKLHRQLGTTIVHVTHDQVEAMTMADRIVVLQSGTIQQYDTPETVYERPANQFVAGFIGSPAMNFFPVEWRQERAILSQGGTVVPLDGETAGCLSKAGNAVLGIRPEHFAIATDAADGIAINVKLVEPLGSDTLIHFDLAGGSAIARVDPALRPKVGDRINLRPQSGKTHLFAASNGQVLR
jgi:multiple sugar transport system ATP-binding protein